jgi:hypothetical protein
LVFKFDTQPDEEELQRKKNDRIIKQVIIQPKSQKKNTG